jgi:hypothetical protein
MRLLLTLAVLGLLLQSQGFVLRSNVVQRALTSRSTQRFSEQPDLLKVKGNEGLLDSARMEKAFRGTGIKVPSSKKLKVGIIGSGLGGMITAMELSEAGHEVEIFDARRFYGGKVGSWKDKDGNHIEMGLHVFFGCYYNLFGIMKRVGSFENLRLKEHTHTFVNEPGKGYPPIGELDFRLGGVGAPINGLVSFARTEQLNLADKFANAVALATSPVVRSLFDFDGGLQDIRNLDNISFSEWFIGKGGSRGSIKRMWDPIAYALGFMDCDNTSARCMLTIFQFFATKTDASVLRMLNGSPAERLLAAAAVGDKVRENDIDALTLVGDLRRCVLKETVARAALQRAGGRLAGSRRGPQSFLGRVEQVQGDWLPSALQGRTAGTTGSDNGSVGSAGGGALHAAAAASGAQCQACLHQGAREDRAGQGGL